MIEDWQNIFPQILKRFPNGPNIQIHQGWYPLIIILDYKLSNIDPNYIIYQIKQKFGELRFYADLSKRLDKERESLFYETLETCERISSLICEFCSYYPVTIPPSNNKQWIETVCSSCIEYKNKCKKQIII